MEAYSLLLINIFKVMKNLEQLKQELLADGIIDANEVKGLREMIYSDGVIDSDEANFLFELNDAVSGNENDSSWETLFIESITNFLLDDEKSPGEIDNDEANWLYDKISDDGKIDDIEKRLLQNLKIKAKNFPSKLDSLI